MYAAFNWRETLDAANQWPAADAIDEQRPMRRFTALGRKLYVQVLVGITLGAAIGLVDPALATSFKPLGDVFIKAIRIVVTPIIFTTIVVGVAKTGDLRQIARLGVRAIVYFEIISTLALLVGLAVISGRSDPASMPIRKRSTRRPSPISSTLRRRQA